MKIHVLAGNEMGTYTVVVHAATPAGNNQAGFAWPTVLVAAKRNKTILTVGAGPGQTTQVEFDAILAGTVIEAVQGFTDNAAWTPAERAAELDAQATQLLSNLTAHLAAELRWYGATRN